MFASMLEENKKFASIMSAKFLIDKQLKIEYSDFNG
jgi:hypothetical protein